MTRIVLLALLVFLSAQPAAALDCSTVDAAATTIRKSTSKQEIASELVKLGAPRSDAENLMRASPDLDAARVNAIRAMSRLRSTCTKRIPA